MTSPKLQSVAVFGLGYVGCVSAACLARLGHSVTGTDKDLQKVEDVRAGRAPFYEPGLEELIQDGLRLGRLKATSDATEALADADIALICVGTPSARNGNLDVTYLRQVATEIASALPGRQKPLVVAIRSTVFPGTCEDVVAPLLAAAGDARVSVVCHPEFLREGTAVKDFLEPSLVVVGGAQHQDLLRVASLYESLGVSPCLVSLRTAELIKYACNAYHAVKISFANEIGALAAHLDVDGSEVMRTLCEDRRLNVSAAYLRPGFAFGGSCLPKDLRALNYRARSLDVDLPMLGAVLNSNDSHLARAIENVMALPQERLGIIGLAFKENTDDLRESPVVTLLEHLIGKGRTARVWDPHIKLDAIYGSNKNFILRAIPHIGQLLTPSLEDLLTWAEAIVITQSPSAEVRERLAGVRVPVLDLSATPRTRQSVVADPSASAVLV